MEVMYYKAYEHKNNTCRERRLKTTNDSRALYKMTGEQPGSQQNLDQQEVC